MYNFNYYTYCNSIYGFILNYSQLSLKKWQKEFLIIIASCGKDFYIDSYLIMGD